MSDQASVSKTARALLAKYKVHQPPVDVEHLAEQLGADVQRRPNSPDVSGLLYRDGKHVVIGVNKDDSSVRQRFTIAHEIGHLRLHPGQELRVDRSVRVNLRGTGDDGRGREEREANWFAAELLMPEPMVRDVAAKLAGERQLSDEDLVNELARLFDVSRVAMGYRLFNLGLVNGL